MDEIIRAVAACPSGALSLSAEGHETRVQVDGAYHRRRASASTQWLNAASGVAFMTRSRRISKPLTGSPPARQ